MGTQGPGTPWMAGKNRSCHRRAALHAPTARHELGILNDVFGRCGVADVGIVQHLQDLLELDALPFHVEEGLGGGALVRVDEGDRRLQCLEECGN